MSADTTGRIAGLLAGHQLIDLYRTSDEQVVAVRCTCREFSTDLFERLDERHAAHVAAVLTEAGVGFVAEVERRGAERALEGLDGLTLITAERRRQVEVEGWTPEHDRQQGVTRLLRAAEAYRSHDSRLWPWDREWWKPKDHVSNLIRAGALYQAASDLEPLTYAATAIQNIAAELDDIFDWLRARTYLGEEA